MTNRKKLIEVALPLDAINRAAAHEKMPGIGAHPRGLHLWWARRPLAACRAVIFASLVDDPEQEGVPQELLDAIDALPAPLQGAADAGGSIRRAKLFYLLERLVKWENTTNETLLETARDIIRAATGGNPPPLLDPFCGGGSIPLEAQRLGLEAYASDLNPVAVLITKALIEIPPKFAGHPPVNPEAKRQIGKSAWKGVAGLAADVRYYGKWARDEAWKRIEHLYPKGPNGETIIAWLWARTVKCPNPACGVQMPLVRSFLLSTKKGKEAWVEPHVDKQAKTVRFEVRTGTPRNLERVKQGTKRGRGAKFFCLVCEQAAEDQHIKDEGMAGRIAAQLLAVVAEGRRSRRYLSPYAVETPEVEAQAELAGLEAEIAEDPRAIWCKLYGLTKFADLFTPRQLVALTTFSDLVGEARTQVLEHSNDDEEYANAVALYLAFSLSRLVDFNSALTRWVPSNEKVMNTFARQGLPMVWDFSEAHPLGESVGSWATCLHYVASCLEVAAVNGQRSGRVLQLDSSSALPPGSASLVATDPPYYDNIGYADISDFFYVWLRKTLGRIFPDLFSTVLTPKQPELVATPYRFGNDRKKAEEHFEEGLAKCFTLLRNRADLEYPFTLYYAFKQAAADESDRIAGVPASTGWETMLRGLIDTGLQVTATWPMRTEQQYRSVAMGTNALASAIVLACRPRPDDAPICRRQDFIYELRNELPGQLRVLMSGRVAPVDLTQACIGPGMAVFSRYSRVIKADGTAMSVREALQEINYVVEDILAQQVGDLDVESQFCVAWFQQYGDAEGPYGEADVLARAKNVSVDGLARLGLVESTRGKVHLTLREGYEDDGDWDPRQGSRLTAWEACQRLVWTLQEQGEGEAGRLARRLGGVAEQARELAFRLYGISDRKGWAEEALGYNVLVASWPEIQRRAAESAEETQGQMESV